MSDTIIQVENLGKKYIIGHQQEGRSRYVALRDVMADGARSIWNRLNPLTQNSKLKTQNSTKEEFWALKDVSFEVKQGEVIGIIGRNGAGKSTLLKILSRITEPTEGRVKIRGRVASLLEVGTGFHPELTGRENIYLNGAILGMTRAEIKKKFDEIVNFAEVEKFLDTPVKHYSSGMYVRLAFAVAAHLEPEILVVDEVLAVGDIEFQKKCLGKMGEVAKNDGKTILFVSHNMGVIQRLCKKAMVLERGFLVHEADADTCVRFYLDNSISSQNDGLVDLSSQSIQRRGNGLAVLEKLELFKENRIYSSKFLFGESFSVLLTIKSLIKLQGVIFGFSFIAADGLEIQGTTAHDGGITGDLYPGIQVFQCKIDPMILTPGKYYLRAAISRYGGELYDYIEEITSIEILQVSDALSKTPYNHYVGYVYLPYQWSKLKYEY